MPINRPNDTELPSVEVKQSPPHHLKNVYYKGVKTLVTFLRVLNFSRIDFLCASLVRGERTLKTL